MDASIKEIEKAAMKCINGQKAKDEFDWNRFRTFLTDILAARDCGPDCK